MSVIPISAPNTASAIPFRMRSLLNPHAALNPQKSVQAMALRRKETARLRPGSRERVATPGIPLHPDLRGVLKKLLKDGLAFLTTQYGKPFKDGASFGNQFREWCKDVGLKDRSAHGLRKSVAVRFVEAECSSKEVAAITGHASLREIERYTKAAEQDKLARQAIARLIRNG